MFSSKSFISKQAGNFFQAAKRNDAQELYNILEVLDDSAKGQMLLSGDCLAFTLASKSGDLAIIELLLEYAIHTDNHIFAQFCAILSQEIVAPEFTQAIIEQCKKNFEEHISATIDVARNAISPNYNESIARLLASYLNSGHIDSLMYQSSGEFSV